MQPGYAKQLAMTMCPWLVVERHSHGMWTRAGRTHLWIRVSRDWSCHREVRNVTDGRQRSKASSADDRVRLIIAFMRVAGQLLVIVHEWLGGPG